MKRGNIIEKDIKIVEKDIKLVEKELGAIERKIWKFVFHFHYPKLGILALLIIIAYIVFRNPYAQDFVASLGALEYIGVFIAGIFFTFGFTTPFAAGFFIVLDPANPFLVAIIGGIGAMLGDLFIFSLIRFSFTDEFKRLEKTKVIKGIRKKMKIHFSNRARLYILYALAGFILASPLPDEAGVIMLAGLTNIRPRIMALIGFVFNTIGIFILCLI